MLLDLHNSFFNGWNVRLQRNQQIFTHLLDFPSTRQKFKNILYKLNTPFFARESSIRYTFGALELLLSCVSPLKNLKVGCLMFLGVI